ncbi:MAG TPA: ATP-binding protein [Stellaceae bacterium]|nr:ATP-binding protein [Stellaceae bacterium]
MAEHDIRLVIVAGIICFLSCLTALSLFARAREADGASLIRTAIWVIAAAAVAGSGVWATNFVSMLGYKTDLQIGYRLDLIVESFVIGLAVAGIGFTLALRGTAASILGGMGLGSGIGVMHYLGIAALSVHARPEWDAHLVVASFAISFAFSGFALGLATERAGTWRQVAAALLLAIAILGLHFTGMAALTLVPDPTIAVSPALVTPHLLSVGVAAAAILIMTMGIVTAVIDRHLADRNMRAAARLRAQVAQLETAKKELEHTSFELKRSLANADESNSAKAKFLATMSHELRTPLNAIIGFSELLTSEAYGKLGDAHYRDYAHDIHESGKHLLGLINDVLDISKLDAVMQVETYREPTDLPDLLRKTVQMMLPQAERAGVTLAESYDRSLPAMRTDERRLRQVLLNLISNAIKFTASGGKVSVSAYRQGGGLAISVADTGIGIAPEDIPKAMENFGQVQSGWSRQTEGTGLGLPLSKRLVELLGGSFVMESQVGVGTNIIISFPAERLMQVPLAA